MGLLGWLTNLGMGGGEVSAFVDRPSSRDRLYPRLSRVGSPHPRLHSPRWRPEPVGIDADIQWQVNSRIVANPTGDYLHIWSDYDIRKDDAWVVPSGGFTLNSACWASGLNFHGVGTAVKGNSYYGVTLVSPVHFITAEHVNINTGTTVYFIKPDGSVYEATVAADSLQVDTEDIDVGLLSEAVPAGIPFYSVLPEDYDDHLTLDPTDLTDTNEAGDDYPTYPTAAQADGLSGKPAVMMEQERRACVGRIVRSAELSSVLVYGTGDPKYPDRDDYWIELVAGDSGWPTFLLVDGELVLLGSHISAIVDRHLAFNADVVNAHMVTLHGSAEYQLTEGNLSVSRHNYSLGVRLHRRPQTQYARLN